MPKLTITNLTTSDIPIQDKSGLSGLSLTVRASKTVTDLAISEEDFEHLQDTLNTLKAASKITYSVKSSEGSVMSVGDRSQGYLYTAGQATWMDIDGVNPPTVGALRFVDQTTGATHIVTIAGGALKIDGA